jgi:hypothetical protein
MAERALFKPGNRDAVGQTLLECWQEGHKNQEKLEKGSKVRGRYNALSALINVCP